MFTNLRIGNGFDIHRFDDKIKGNFNIKIAGLDIPFKYKIIAHSDGDVVLHSLCDAIFGSIAEGNIGVHFPPSDPKWKDASSDIFLQYALNMLKDKGGEIVNIDTTIICEEPKIMPHSIKMRENLARMINISIENISIKATTTEKMGFLGRQEGIACFCNILIYIKNNNFT